MRWTTGLALLICGCAGGGLPDPICDSGAQSWSPGTSAFAEATTDWGLEGVEGVRLAAIDFDGDGWVDLHVHRGGNGASDDFAPDGTRHSWLLRNDEGRGFVDVTESSGFRTARTTNGSLGRPGSVVAFADVDNDGDLDGFTAVNDLDGSVDETSELMLNQGDGTFVLGPAGPWSADRGAPAGATFVDVDQDGNLDLWLPRNSLDGNPQKDQLFRGSGNGEFANYTRDVGIDSVEWSAVDDLNAGLAHTNAWSANACDLNGDGWPELLAASYGRAPNHLWQNEGGVVTNRSVDSGYAYDGNQDFTDNQFFLCFCEANPTAADCAGAATPAISCTTQNWRDSSDREAYRNGGNSAATSCRDVDNDGDIDLLTGEIQHWWAGQGSDEAQLLINDGSADVHFDRPGVESLGLTRDLPGNTWDKGDMTNSFLDFDNDGWADVFIGSSDYEGARALLWHQDSALSFTPVDTADFFEHNRSHGVAVADFDRDGDLDVVVGHSRARCSGTNDCYDTSQIRLFENQLGGNFLQLDLEGVDGANRGAVGARIRVTTGEITQTLEIGAGYGHYGAQNPHRVHVGLGNACEAEVEVRWPDAAHTTETFTLPAGHEFRLIQGDEIGPLPVWPRVE